MPTPPPVAVYRLSITSIGTTLAVLAFAGVPTAEAIGDLPPTAAMWILAAGITCALVAAVSGFTYPRPAPQIDADALAATLEDRLADLADIRVESLKRALPVLLADQLHGPVSDAVAEHVRTALVMAMPDLCDTVVGKLKAALVDVSPAAEARVREELMQGLRQAAEDSVRLLHREQQLAAAGNGVGNVRGIFSAAGRAE